jgi:preprotein translocase subunit SecD
MTKAVKTRVIVIVGVLLLAVYGIIGLPKSVDELKTNLANNIRLGLDLKGGSFLVLEVQVQDAVKAEADRVIEGLKEDLRKAGIDYEAMDRNDPTSVKEADSVQVSLRGVPGAKAGDLRTLVGDRYPSWILTPVSSTDYRLNLKPTELIGLKNQTMERTKQTIESRVNSLGVGETTIQERRRAGAEFELVVELPGVDDLARVKQIMQMAAMLELSEVKGGPYVSQDDARAKSGGVLPIGTKLVRGIGRGAEGGETWYLLTRAAVVTGRDLRNARASRGEMGRWETDFVLSKDGARRFARFTEANIGNRLAIVLDNQVRSAPTIQNRIEDSGRITGAANEQDAADLALVLRAGSLPAGITYPEERTVGPSLGADSIRQGIVAGIVGLTAVILAMLLYYKGAGVNAVLALVLNAVILLAVLGYAGAVLTLPGIAGVILTIGMAVDSNVLIFERIREELRAGKGVIAAVDTGFNKAFLTIIDTHVTTVVSCAFLFMFGTGPVKGFAVTLVIGLIANVFTAVFVSRTMFDWHLNRRWQVTRLSI